MNSDSKVKEGVCYFLKSRLPTAEGTVNGRKVEVLRDTGCTCCTVKRSLVSDDHLIRKESYVSLIDETTQTYPLAVIDVDRPFFTGKTESLCMEDTLYDLVIGNIDGSKLPEMSHFSAAAVTRSQAKQSENACRKLKVHFTYYRKNVVNIMECQYLLRLALCLPSFALHALHIYVPQISAFP